MELTEQDAIRTTRLPEVLSMSCLSAGPSGEARRKTEIFKDDEPALTARIRLVMSQSVAQRWERVVFFFAARPGSDPEVPGGDVEVAWKSQ